MSDWILIPTLDCLDFTRQAVADSLAQTGVDPKVLVVNNGGSDVTRQGLDALQLQHPEQVFVWHHEPPLPSLSACWNRMLQFVWATGETHALVINNDVRLHPRTYEYLRDAQTFYSALFVSGVGVQAEQFQAAGDPYLTSFTTTTRGGPDFSCFLLTKAGHERYPFDEGFVPAYCEDLDLHRRYMLGGDGDKIFSVNLPFLHYASRTLNQSEEHRHRLIRRIDQSRAYYRRKWGGDVNQERWAIPFQGEGATVPAAVRGADVTTPTLQRLVQAGEPFPWIPREEESDAPDTKSV